MKNYQNYLIILLIALIPVVNGVFAILTLCAIIFGIFHVSQIKLRSLRIFESRPATLVLGSLVTYGVTGIIFSLIHNHKLGAFEAYIPFILSPIIFYGFFYCKLDENTLWISAALAAILGLMIALLQVYQYDYERAYGGLKGPIIFGDICILFASISLIGILPNSNKLISKRFLNYLLFTGFVSGVYASILSGSKGGWISIFTTLIIFIWLWLRNKNHLFKIAIFTCAAVGIIILFYFSPNSLVQERLISGIKGGYQWLQNGDVTEGSVSIRLSFWAAGIKMYVTSANNWLFGIPPNEIESKLVEYLVTGMTGINFENDLVHSLVTTGLIGFLIKIYLFSSIFYAFRALKKNTAHKSYYLGLSGSLLVIIYIEFGLSVLTFAHNAFRHVFVLFTLLILSIILKKNELNQNAAIKY